MAPTELIATMRKLVDDARRDGKERLVLLRQMRGGNSPRNWDRAQIVPGLFGRCIGAGNYIGQYVFDVEVAAIEAWLQRVEREKAGR